jgi:hypothetical protein
MRELVGDEVVIRPWLQSFPLRVTTGFDAKYIRTQIEAARDAGGTGWLLWSPGNYYNDAYRAMQDLMRPENPPDVLDANRDHQRAEPVLPAPDAKAAPEPAPESPPARQQLKDIQSLGNERMPESELIRMPGMDGPPRD